MEVGMRNAEVGKEGVGYRTEEMAHSLKKEHEF
jgi:hypothetical protein